MAYLKGIVQQWKLNTAFQTISTTIQLKLLTLDGLSGQGPSIEAKAVEELIHWFSWINPYTMRS